jgi:hypothetical protein
MGAGLQFLLTVTRAILPDSAIRAMVLKGLRYVSVLATGAMIPVLIHYGVSAPDAATIAGAVGTIIVAGGGSIAGMVLDYKSVANQKNAVQASAAVTAANAVATGQTSPEAIQAASGSPQALQNLLSQLKAGTVK